MKYMILGEEGKEYGPVDAETLKKWVEHGRVFRDTRVRNALMKRYNLAGDLEFLKDAFEGQEELQEQETGIAGKLLKAFLPVKKEEDEKPEEEQFVSTAFKNRYIPNPATFFKRVNSFLLDAVLLAAFAVILFCIMNFMTGTFGLGEFSSDFTKGEIAAGLGAGGDVDPETAAAEVAAAKKEAEEKKKAERSESDEAKSAVNGTAEAENEKAKEPPTPRFKPSKSQIERLNKLFPLFFAVFVAGVLLYYGIALGLFAQTYGMHYWGIFIVKGHDGEAFPLRAYAFFLASLILWPLMPLFVILNPSKRTLHGYLTGCRLISITAKPK
jgi:uncharacterized RDD family membrane protein YckC